jgi:beta-glucosidase
MRSAVPIRRPNRSRRGRQLFLLALVCPLIFLAGLAQSALSRNRALRYRDASLPAATRADDLLGRMTLAEKVGQLAQVSVAQLKTDADPDRIFAYEAGLGY